MRIVCGTLLRPFYVSNGALIIAAVHAGFHDKVHLDDFGFEQVNVTFNMAKPVIDNPKSLASKFLFRDPDRGSAKRPFCWRTETGSNSEFW